MNAIRFETTIDEIVAGAMPELRPMIGRRVEVIALDAVSSSSEGRPISFDEFLAHRLERPAGVEPVSLEDMERAIRQGAMGDDV